MAMKKVVYSAALKDELWHLVNQVLNDDVDREALRDTAVTCLRMAGLPVPSDTEEDDED